MGCANVERTSTIYFDRALRSGPHFDTLFVAEQLPLDADRHQRHLLIVRSQNVAHYTHYIGIYLFGTDHSALLIACRYVLRHQFTYGV